MKIVITKNRILGVLLLAVMALVLSLLSVSLLYVVSWFLILILSIPGALSYAFAGVWIVCFAVILISIQEHSKNNGDEDA